jgi:hypothetical protein
MRVAVLLITVIVLSGASVAEAQGWRLVGSYPTPVSNPRGYWVYSISSGYIVGAGSAPYVYEYYLPTCSVLSSIQAPGGSGAWGIAGYTSSRMYISNNRTSWIYEITSTGSVTSSFLCPVAGPADMNLDWISGYLYVAIPDKNVIAVVDETTGSLASTFAGPGSGPTACCGYKTTLVADAATHTVYEDGVPVITGIETPVGADEEASTDYDYYVALFIVDDATDRIYFYNKTVAVTPASLGKVKALFE